MKTSLATAPVRCHHTAAAYQIPQPAIFRTGSLHRPLTSCFSPLQQSRPLASSCIGAAAAQPMAAGIVSSVEDAVASVMDSVVALPTPAKANSVVVNLTPETFNEFMRAAGDRLVLVDFYTDWCGPCQIMHKEMDKLTLAFPKGVLFTKFNCGDHPAFTTTQRIRSLPTFKLFQRGRLLEQVTGAKPIVLRQLLVHYYRGK